MNQMNDQKFLYFMPKANGSTPKIQVPYIAEPDGKQAEWDKAEDEMATHLGQIVFVYKEQFEKLQAAVAVANRKIDEIMFTGKIAEEK